MRDGIALAKAGHPAVVLVDDKFERAARAQAKVLGIPDLVIYVYDHYLPGESDAAEHSKAARLCRELPYLLQTRG